MSAKLTICNSTWQLTGFLEYMLLPLIMSTSLSNHGYGWGVLRATCNCVKASDNTRAVGQEAGERLPAEQARRVILCSGQIYYRLFHARRARQIQDIILVRLEQIAPFPHDLVTQVPAASMYLPLHPAHGSRGSPYWFFPVSYLEASDVLLGFVFLPFAAMLKRPSQARHDKAGIDSCGITLNSMAAAKAQEASPIDRVVMLIETDCPAAVAKLIANSPRKAGELRSFLTSHVHDSFFEGKGLYSNICGCAVCTGGDAVCWRPSDLVSGGAQEHGGLALCEAPHGHRHEGARGEPGRQCSAPAHQICGPPCCCIPRSLPLLSTLSQRDTHLWLWPSMTVCQLVLFCACCMLLHLASLVMTAGWVNSDTYALHSQECLRVASTAQAFVHFT